MTSLRTIATIALIAAACGGSSNNKTNPDAPGPDAAPPTGMSFASAFPIGLDVATGTNGTLPDTKTKVYYTFTLDAGDRITAATQTNAEMTMDGSVTDTIVTVYDSAQAAFAQDDDGWPRGSTDSQLFFEAGAAGTYYLTVEDCNSANSSGCYPASGVTDFNYTLFVDHVAKASPEVNAASTQDGTTAHAQSVTYAVPQGGTAGDYGFYTLDGNFPAATSTHVFGFVPPAATVDITARMHVEFWVQPIGKSNGDGSTSNIKAWITAGNGTLIASEADQSNFKDGDNATNGPLDLTLPVSQGVQYYLFVENTASASMPATDYYFIEHFAGQFFFGTKEAEGPGVGGASGTNETVGTAQKLATPQGADAGSFFADGDIGVAGDIDYYEVNPPSGSTMASLGCSAAREGSGVQGLSVTLYGTNGTTVIGTLGPETATADLANANPFAVPAGTTKAYIKVSATGQDLTNTGTFYRCNVFYQ